MIFLTCKKWTTGIFHADITLHQTHSEMVGSEPTPYTVPCWTQKDKSHRTPPLHLLATMSTSPGMLKPRDQTASAAAWKLCESTWRFWCWVASTLAFPSGLPPHFLFWTSGEHNYVCPCRTGPSLRNRTRCDIVKLPKSLRDLFGTEMKTEVEKTNQDFNPSSHKLNVITTTFKEKFTSWQPQGWGRMGPAGPTPALLAFEITQVLLPCPDGLAAMLSSRQGLGISFSMAPQLHFSLLLTRLKLIWWPWGLLLSLLPAP